MAKREFDGETVVTYQGKSALVVIRYPDTGHALIQNIISRDYLFAHTAGFNPACECGNPYVLCHPET